MSGLSNGSLRRIRRAAALGAMAVVVSLAPAAPLSGQTTTAEVIGLGISGSYVSLVGGDAFDGLEPGIGFEATGRIAIRRSVTLGAGVRWSNHEVEGLDLDGDVWGIFGDLRLVGHGHTAYPFGGLRIGYVEKDFEVPGGDDSGLEGAAVLGVALPLMPSLALEVAGVASFAWMDDTGTSVGLSAGLAFWFP